MKTFSKVISTFFGIGYFPVASGTLASLITVIIYKYCLSGWAWPHLLFLFFFGYILGVAASSKYVSLKAVDDDPSEVVIDEVIGQAAALFMLKSSWFVFLSAFFLFRFFDILKPLGIKRAEKFSKGWGIMLDDIMAGIYTSILINVALLLIK